MQTIGKENRANTGGIEHSMVRGKLAIQKIEMKTIFPIGRKECSQEGMHLIETIEMDLAKSGAKQ